jgi:hypothetical protein
MNGVGGLYGYKWHFSKEYPQFPKGRKELERGLDHWTHSEAIAFLEAIKEEHLVLIRDDEELVSKKLLLVGSQPVDRKPRRYGKYIL